MSQKAGIAVVVSVVALTALVRHAQAVEDAFAVSVGSEIVANAPLDVDFSGKKPKVSAIYTGPLLFKKGEPSLKLKVTANDAGSVSLTVSKAKGPGRFDLQVTPRGGDPVVVGVIESHGPEPASLDSETVAPSGELTITGQFFGTKKPKVYIGGKKAKTLTFSDTEIKVRAHKKTPAGIADVLVRNKVGDGTIADAVDVGGSGGGGGDQPELIRLRTKGSLRANIAADDASIDGTWSGSGFTATGSTTSRGVEYVFDLSVAFDLTTVSGLTGVDLDATAGDTCSLRVTESGTKTFALDAAGNGTRGSVRIKSFDSQTGYVVLDLDMDLRDAPSGDTANVTGDVAVLLRSQP